MLHVAISSAGLPPADGGAVSLVQGLFFFHYRLTREPRTAGRSCPGYPPVWESEYTGIAAV